MPLGAAVSTANIIKTLLCFLSLIPFSAIPYAFAQIPARTIEIRPQEAVEVRLSHFSTSTPPEAPIPQLSPKTALFMEYPILKKIAACESTGNVNAEPRQFLPDGSVLWGNDLTGKPIKRDEGILQVNTRVWGKLAISMGYDLATEEGNLKFGKYLFDTYGTAPWNPSKQCWNL